MVISRIVMVIMSFMVTKITHSQLLMLTIHVPEDWPSIGLTVTSRTGWYFLWTVCCLNLTYAMTQLIREAGLSFSGVFTATRISTEAGLTTEPDSATGCEISG